MQIGFGFIALTYQHTNHYPDESHEALSGISTFCPAAAADNTRAQY